MKTFAQTLTLLLLCGTMSAGAAQHFTSSSPPPQPLSTGSASLDSSQTQPKLVPVGLHQFPAPRHVVFVNGGFWWGYPYGYYGYPYGYYRYPYGYYGYPAASYGKAYEKVGKEWGKGLREGKVTVDQFVTFLQLDILRASDTARSHFQVGFLKGYGKNGLTLFTRALSQAKASLPAPSATGQPSPGTQPPGAPAGKQPFTAPRYQ